jgi:hypothetical protein
MVAKQTMLEFKGKLTYNDISAITQQLERCMTTLHEKIGIYKKLLTITVETLENILKYAEKLGDPVSLFMQSPAFFQLVKNSDHYLIQVSNPIRNTDIQALKIRIDAMNELNKKDIKTLYNKTIANGIFSDQGGAGLGILEILKASNHKIDYIFEEINQGFSYFSLFIELKCE